MELIDFNNIYSSYLTVVLICTGIFGLLMGSFLNVLIYRIPQTMFSEWKKDCYEFLELDNISENDNLNTNNNSEQNITVLKPARSICPNCFYQIAATDNIPVISYLLLIGKCRNCSVNIPIKYPLVELCTSLISMLIIYQFGLTITSGFVILISYLILTAAVIDLEHMIIPDNLTYVGIWSGLIFNLKFLNTTSFTSIEFAILGAVVGYLSLWLIYWFFKLATGKEGFGYGDFKLTALFGAWLGIELLLPLLIIASITAILFAVINSIFKIREIDKPFPFGPYLVFSGWILLMYQEHLPLNKLSMILS